jgi:integration host factor subunit beta
VRYIYTVNRSDLIAHIAARTPTLSPKDAEVSVHLILASIADALAGGGRVEIRGFGSFVLNYRPPRKCRNPKSGERKLREFGGYYNGPRVHQSLGGSTPQEQTGEQRQTCAALDSFAWREHCRGVFQTPIAV